jgi:hypothetical protein
MSAINWDNPFHVNLDFPGHDDHPVSAPTYGNFGGPSYSAGQFLDSPNPAPANPVPVDALDQAFQDHDVASGAAATAAAQSAADLALIQAIQAVDPGMIDAGAGLYGGAATLAMVEQLAARGDLDLLPPEALLAIAGEAIRDIGEGLAGLDAEDAAGVNAWLDAQDGGWLFF